MLPLGHASHCKNGCLLKVLICLQQLPSLLNQPPLPPPSFPLRSQPLGATRLSIGSSAQQQPPLALAPALAPAVEPYNSSFGVSFAAPAGGTPSTAIAAQSPAGAAHGEDITCRRQPASHSSQSLVTPCRSAVSTLWTLCNHLHCWRPLQGRPVACSWRICRRRRQQACTQRSRCRCLQTWRRCRRTCCGTTRPSHGRGPSGLSARRCLCWVSSSCMAWHLHIVLQAGCAILS